MTTPENAQSYVYFEDLNQISENAPDESIVSRTIHKSGKTRVFMFDFAPGQTLSDHSSGSPAIIQILSGEATLGLGDEMYEAHGGSWAYMQARLSHSVTAKTAVKMMLIMLPNQAD
ncbi:MAG: cupin domain-containing protein [Anaerolineae bacterium]|nr:cupin domain-containing protein [Anaerolineae bacterium]